MSDPVRIPIDSYLDVADAVKRLVDTGVPRSDLFIEVRRGEMELRDASSTYGVRRFRAAAGLGKPR